ncbi:hypothetical protein GBA52_013711 [Prunus armeniaca]|nr:hypothetical protein GBA52_013711 [Prunus armeniaca]
MDYFVHPIVNLGLVRNLTMPPPVEAIPNLNLPAAFDKNSLHAFSYSITDSRILQ